MSIEKQVLLHTIIAHLCRAGMFGSISWNSEGKLPDAKLGKDSSKCHTKDSSKCHTDHSKYRVNTHSLQSGGVGGRFKRLGVERLR